MVDVSGEGDWEETQKIGKWEIKGFFFIFIISDYVYFAFLSCTLLQLFWT